MFAWLWPLPAVVDVVHHFQVGVVQSARVDLLFFQQPQVAVNRRETLDPWQHDQPNDGDSQHPQQQSSPSMATSFRGSIVSAGRWELLATRLVFSEHIGGSGKHFFEHQPSHQQRQDQIEGLPDDIQHERFASLEMTCQFHEIRF